MGSFDASGEVKTPQEKVRLNFNKKGLIVGHRGFQQGKKLGFWKWQIVNFLQAGHFPWRETQKSRRDTEEVI